MWGLYCIEGAVRCNSCCNQDECWLDCRENRNWNKGWWRGRSNEGGTSNSSDLISIDDNCVLKLYVTAVAIYSYQSGADPEFHLEEWNF